MFDAVKRIGRRCLRKVANRPPSILKAHKAKGITIITGFFYITNFGLSQGEVDQQFGLCKKVFELPTEEKLKYRADLEHGGYNGYKPLGLRKIKGNIPDNTEITTSPSSSPNTSGRIHR